MEKIKKDGTIRAIRKDNKAFTLTDDQDRWYSSFDAVKISKGNNVEFEYIEVTKNDKTFYNFYNLKVLNSDSKNSLSNDRINIDAGNCVRAAVDICIEKDTPLHDTLLEVLKEFKYARKSLLNKDELNIIEPKEVSEVSETEY